MLTPTAYNAPLLPSAMFNPHQPQYDAAMQNAMDSFLNYFGRQFNKSTRQVTPLRTAVQMRQRRAQDALSGPSMAGSPLTSPAMVGPSPNPEQPGLNGRAPSSFQPNSFGSPSHETSPGLNNIPVGQARTPVGGPSGWPQLADMPYPTLPGVEPGLSRY